MDEKRRGPRVRANIVVNFKVKSIRLVGGSRIKDISVVGICLPSKHYFPVDSILDLEIRSEELKEPIKVSARVARISNRNSSKFQFEVGLDFLDLPLPKRDELNNYIQRVLAQGQNMDISWLD